MQDARYVHLISWIPQSGSEQYVPRLDITGTDITLCGFTWCGYYLIWIFLVWILPGMDIPGVDIASVGDARLVLCVHSGDGRVVAAARQHEPYSLRFSTYRCIHTVQTYPPPPPNIPAPGRSLRMKCEGKKIDT